MARTPEKYRIRTVHLIGSEQLSTGVQIAGSVVLSHVFQDDVLLIGMSIHAHLYVPDSHINLDGAFESTLQISRQAFYDAPGAYLDAFISSTWDASKVIGGGCYTDRHMMFPRDYGVDFDEGESINLLRGALWISAAGDGSYTWRMGLFYVER